MASHSRSRILLFAVAALAVLIQALAVAYASAGSSSSAPATTAATKLCNVKKQLPNGRVVTVYKTKVVKRKVNGKVKRVRVPITKHGKKVPKRAACSKTKLCVVKKRNKKGRLAVVYLTKVGKVRVIRGNRIVTVKKRVFVYRLVTVTKKVKGKKKKVKVRRKVAKLGKCAAKKKSSNTTGIPVTISVVDPSVAHLDFGGFQRDVPLRGTVSGFIVGKGFVLGQDNQIQLTKAHITLVTTGIFIDDECGGNVSDSIRVNDQSIIEIDEGSTGNTVQVAPNSSITGLIHLRIQTALEMRNDDDGCDKPYFTTGWTDFDVPLFLKGKISATKDGLTSTINTGETVLNDLAACLAPGDPTLPCNGYAIPFPAILKSTIIGLVKIG